MASQFLSDQKTIFPDLASAYDNFESLFSRKLWHQLSVALEEFLLDPSHNRDDSFYNLYDSFITTFEARLSQIKLSQIVAMIAYSFEDPVRSTEFLNRVLESRGRLGEEASLCIDTDIVIMKLRVGDLDEARNLLDAAGEKLKESNTNEAVVFSKYYKACTEFRKSAGPPEEFYKASLMYLAYTPVESLSAEQQFCLATDMVLAALTGDGVYNFGEVVATPVLKALENSPNHYLHDIVIAINNGDIDAFNSIVESNKDAYFSHEVLSNCHATIQQKVVLVALMNIVFERHSHDRTISYSTIANAAKIPLEQVDWVLMRAMSLGLIKGTINEVEQVVNVTWVQPKVLDNSQINLLVNQVDNWTEKVKDTLLSVEDQALELYA
mmetsp:Transcript_31586/g.68892  ORF Transcript_31586/g.68892 Transcript_31586/m.68892 type:complete len:381 (+) Transcript_31586:58-1200(+)